MKRLNTRLANSVPKIRLDDYLSDWIPATLSKPISKSKIRTLILSGAVYVNRHRNKIPSTIIFAGAVLEVYFDEAKIGISDQQASQPLVSIKNEKIIFEDEWIIIVNKDPGVPTQPTIDPGRANLFDLTKQFLTRRDAKINATPYLGLHHRLDRDTSGIVMFTKKEEANKKFFRLTLGTEVRLKNAYIIIGESVVKDTSGKIIEIHCTYDEDSRSGSGTEASQRKVKGTIHWVSINHAIEAEVRIYDRLFTHENPDGDKDVDFKEYINPNSLQVITGYLEPSLVSAKNGERFQFQRLGYYCVDKDSSSKNLVFNKTVGLRDTWAKVESKE